MTLNGPTTTAMAAPVMAIPVPAPAVAGLPAPVPPTGRLAAELEGRWRVVAAVVAGLSLVYGGILAWRANTNGVAVAAHFGVGIISFVFALAGVVPASVKLGDLEVKLQQAQEQAREEGKQQGSLAGLQAAVEIAQLPPSERDEVKDSLAEALRTDEPLSLSQVELPLPKLADADARRNAATITDALMAPDPRGSAERRP
jgi:uncharacterized membrane protein